MTNRYKPVNTQKIERWLGVEKADGLRRAMQGWYGRPIYLIDVPGNVWIDSDGQFVGDFKHGFFASALDSLEDYIKRFWREAGRPQYGTFSVGFASISDALQRASQGNTQRLNFKKSGPTGVVGVSSTLWRVGPQPAAGGAGASAPGGTIHNSTNLGALTYQDPASGTLHLVGADVSASILQNSLLIYDRLYSVAKTMNSTAAEDVTGVPTRYQSNAPLAQDYAGDNFLFVEVGGTALAATAHNWTGTYTNQSGTDGQVLPSLTGNASAIVGRLDHPVQSWFAPLASGDVGLQKLTQMSCSATVATGEINFVIGHPIGFLSFPVSNSLIPFDWLTNRDQVPRIFDGACLAGLEVIKPSATACTYTGRLYFTSAAP